MSAILRKVSDSPYPGFEEFATYLLATDQELWKFKSNDDVKNDYTAVVFGDSGGSGLSEMLRIMNLPEFRVLHNLLPAGTTALAAFCQILTLRYRDKIGLAGYKGTYTLKYSLWPQVSTDPLGMRTVEWTYKVASRSRATVPVTVSV